MPQVTMPRMVMPQVAMPQMAMPQVAMPQVAMPYMQAEIYNRSDADQDVRECPLSSVSKNIL